ncbi:hypothetical protein FXO38_32313 [Capsicum annuum]|nr:hypothetical protein FXO38_32313 [Capsicum annuum]
MRWKTLIFALTRRLNLAKIALIVAVILLFRESFLHCEWLDVSLDFKVILCVFDFSQVELQLFSEICGNILRLMTVQSFEFCVLAIDFWCCFWSLELRLKLVDFQKQQGNAVPVTLYYHSGNASPTAYYVVVDESVGRQFAIVFLERVKMILGQTMGIKT